MPDPKHDEPIWRQITRDQQLNGRPLLLFDSIDSTNSQALTLARQGAKTGTIVIARTQSNGRGRLGKIWNSPQDTGLYFSIISRPHLSPENLSKITLAAGLALRNGVAGTSGIKPRLKWPNDLLFEHKKMAGVLTETTLTPNNGQTNYRHNGTAVIIGVGLNVNTTPEAFPKALAGKATSMCIAARRHFDKGVILTAIVREIEGEIERLENNDFKGILADWRGYDATYGKRLTWLTPKGEKVTGISLGPDDNGLLHIKDARGVDHPVLSGDLEIVP